ncbi:hypothetical protein ABEB36_011851 [Hypothenemus hampei]|uniref:Uncharacterized protein n=1 Tax=Hypothenemus hampei TaxID=57062 RepID=A0ABD1E9E1_HYPHA
MCEQPSEPISNDKIHAYIYDDVDDADIFEFEPSTAKISSEKNEKIQSGGEDLLKENEELKKKVYLLETRISELYLTAKAEIERKDSRIRQLNDDINNMVFRRNNRNFQYAQNKEPLEVNKTGPTERFKKVEKPESQINFQKNELKSNIFETNKTNTKTEKQSFKCDKDSKRKSNESNTRETESVKKVEVEKSNSNYKIVKKQSNNEENNEAKGNIKQIEELYKKQHQSERTLRKTQMGHVRKEPRTPSKSPPNKSNNRRYNYYRSQSPRRFRNENSKCKSHSKEKPDDLLKNDRHSNVPISNYRDWKMNLARQRECQEKSLINHPNPNDKHKSPKLDVSPDEVPEYMKKMSDEELEKVLESKRKLLEEMSDVNRLTDAEEQLTEYENEWKCIDECGDEGGDVVKEEGIVDRPERTKIDLKEYKKRRKEFEEKIEPKIENETTTTNIVKHEEPSISSFLHDFSLSDDEPDFVETINQSESKVKILDITIIKTANNVSEVECIENIQEAIKKELAADIVTLGEDVKEKPTANEDEESNVIILGEDVKKNPTANRDEEPNEVPQVSSNLNYISPFTEESLVRNVDKETSTNDTREKQETEKQEKKKKPKKCLKIKMPFGKPEKTQEILCDSLTEKINGLIECEKSKFKTPPKRKLKDGKLNEEKTKKPRRITPVKIGEVSSKSRKRKSKKSSPLNTSPSRKQPKLEPQPDQSPLPHMEEMLKTLSNVIVTKEPEHLPEINEHSNDNVSVNRINLDSKDVSMLGAFERGIFDNMSTFFGETETPKCDNRPSSPLDFSNMLSRSAMDTSTPIKKESPQIRNAPLKRDRRKRVKVIILDSNVA